MCRTKWFITWLFYCVYILSEISSEFSLPLCVYVFVNEHWPQLIRYQLTYWQSIDGSFWNAVQHLFWRPCHVLPLRSGLSPQALCYSYLLNQHFWILSVDWGHHTALLLGSTINSLLQISADPWCYVIVLFTLSAFNPILHRGYFQPSLSSNRCSHHFPSQLLQTAPSPTTQKVGVSYGIVCSISVASSLIHTPIVSRQFCWHRPAADWSPCFHSVLLLAARVIVWTVSENVSVPLLSFFLHCLQKWRLTSCCFSQTFYCEDFWTSEKLWE